MFKKAYKELQKELVAAHRRSYEAQWKKGLEKNKARLTYDRIQLIKARKPTEAVEAKLKALEKGEIQYPVLDENAARTLVEAEDDLQNLENVVMYLRNQRVYNELLERYNPGLTMSQEDNVRKTANMVGLAVPEK